MEAEDKKPSSVDVDHQIAQRQFLRYQRAYERGHEEYMAKAKQCAAFYVGDQWDEKVKATLTAEGRPALTINTILSTVNAVLGEQSTNRMDIAFKPRHLTDSDETADTLTKLFRQISDENQLDWVEGEVFADGIIEERGYFDVRMDFSENIAGEVRITAKDPKDVILDPDAKEYDPTTWSEVFTSRFMSPAEVGLLYGKDKEDKLNIIGASNTSFGPFSMIIEEDKFGEAEYAYSGDGADEDDRKTVRFVRVVERQYRKMNYARHFVDMRTGDTKPVPETWDDEKVMQFQAQFQLGIVKKLTPQIRWTVSADKVLLHDAWSPYNSYTIIPYFPYFRRGKPFGVVSNLLSPQEQLNKVSSQELHIVNTTANSGWVLEDGSLVNMTEDDLARDGAKTGLVLVHARGTNKPDKITPNQIPTGLDRIGMKAAANIREISGVNDGMLGNTSPEVSGVALEAKQARGQVQIQVALDNLARSRRFLALKVLELVQQFYTNERVYRIVDETHPEQAEQEVVINQPQADGSILNDITLGKYDVVVSTQPARDNFGDIQFAEAMNLRTAGVAIPDHVVIEYSHLTHKREIAEQVKQLTGMAPPSPEEQQLMDLQQQMAIESAQLEIQKLDAEKQELLSRARLNEAKAEHTSESHATQLEQIDKQISSKREELFLRLQLAQMTNRVKQQQMGANMLMKRADLERSEPSKTQPDKKTP
ncbi:genomic island protein [Motiliproteus coralliicola]|uniref:Genomic island protein n=1 Tax=Motiliproteus coralliicola TaxID=2283196 RepID=A0A369WTX9_9GAMM|nr:genomic island protein [Motiliproteus coralliicola]RDE25132.1 genomic island protein [Motiliproteus coralliicola]